MAEHNFIEIRGAREHNLKNIDISIPKNRLTVITGLSGSGKSSLAFDTVYAEGQRRYVESLSSYARQFLELMKKPDVDSIEGLSPAISIEQKTTSHNPRSTVGTVTEIYDYMRLLWARAGTPYSPATGLPIESQTVSQMVDRIAALPEGSRILLLAPIARGKKGEFKKEFENLQRQGYQRLKIDGAVYGIEELPELNKNQKHDIEVVVDRLVIKPGLESRLAQSTETALKLGDGLMFAEDVSSGSRITFSSKFACPVSGFTIEEIEPRLFSFNNPYGACPYCDGIGARLYMDPCLIVPNENLSMAQGAILPWYSRKHGFYNDTLESLCQYLGISMKTPWKDLPENAKNVILYGSGSEPVPMYYSRFVTHKPFEGVVNNLERRFMETDSQATRDEFAQYQSAAVCEHCGGKRLKPEALAIKIAGLDIMDVSAMSIKQALGWFAGAEEKLSPQKREIAHKILKEIVDRLNFLNNVGLEYLSLSRQSGTLSGGEAQRIRLASQIGSGLTGVMYVLDEPSIGLHQRDNDKLIATLKNLRDLGNTVIVVEHDEDTMRSADYIVDVGPGAGVHGGEIVAAGSVKDICKAKRSITGDYLSGRKRIEVPQTRRPGNGNFLTVKGARENNLRNIDVKFPLGEFVCVTGISGSGKSSLINEILYKTLACELNGARSRAGKCDGIEGLEFVDKVIGIDQQPIGRTPRSNPATYTGVFNDIRTVFSQTQDAKMRGYGPGRFSFNVRGGRCEACEGNGILQIEMHFLPDVYVPCEVCKGARYNRETLEVKYKEKTISDVLNMTVEEAVVFFANQPKIARKLQTLLDVGLGYVTLGQSATTLSGGEAQRVKLANELARRSTGKTVYILDEPTTGLHMADVHRLIEVLQKLVDAGNTVIVIEHNLDLIKCADYIIDLGPEGGSAGGLIVAEGTPEQVAEAPGSFTGQYLKPLLEKDAKLRAEGK